jgi:hypothetical protein
VAETTSKVPDGTAPNIGTPQSARFAFLSRSLILLQWCDLRFAGKEHRRILSFGVGLSLPMLRKAKEHAAEHRLTNVDRLAVSAQSRCPGCKPSSACRIE